MYKLNQTEPATFSNLSCWPFFRDSVFLYVIELTLYISHIWSIFVFPYPHDWYNLEKKWSHGSINHNNHNKITWKLQTHFDLVCPWGIMKKCNIPHAPSTGLSGTQFATLKSAWINDPEGPKNIITLRYITGHLFAVATRHLTHAVVKYKHMEEWWSLGSINHYKIT
jgi:hypothetical protein